MLEERQAAAEAYERALWAAEATRHDEVAAEAAVMLVAVGAEQLHPAEAERWGQLADATLERMGPGHERLKGWLAQNRGRVHFGDPKTAEAELRLAIALKRKAYGEDGSDVAISIEALAEARARGGDFATAIVEVDRARAIFERVSGPRGL